MNAAALLALLAITLTDPTGDAIGDGTLDPPTSPIYANMAVFDLHAVELQVSESGSAVLNVTMGALGRSAVAAGAEVPEDAGVAEPATPPTDAPEGSGGAQAEEADQFDISGLLAVIDVYLDTGEGGADQTLRGPNMLFPVGSGWHHAVRISSEGAWGITYLSPEEPTAEGAQEPGAPEQSPAGTEEPLGEDVPASAEVEPGNEPATLTRVPLEVVRRGNVLSMVLPWTFDPETPVDLFAVTGVHDPFSPDAWRPLSPVTSPWSFSGGEQVSPVIDLLAPDADAQTQALRTGVLPVPAVEPSNSLPLSPWLWLMIGGLAVALFGLVLRGRVAAPAAVAPDSEDAEATDLEVEAPESEAEEAGTPEAEATGAVTEEAGTEIDEVEVVVVEDPIDAPDDLEDAPEVTDEAPVEGDTIAPVVGEPESAPDTEPEAQADSASAALVAPDTEEDPNDVENVDDEVDVAGTLITLEDPVEDLPEAPDEAGSGRSDEPPSGTFGTGVDSSYLETEEDDLLLGAAHEDGESFWHPASRVRRTLVESAPAAAGGSPTQETSAGTEAPTDEEV